MQAAATPIACFTQVSEPWEEDNGGNCERAADIAVLARSELQRQRKAEIANDIVIMDGVKVGSMSGRLTVIDDKL
jgi:hypothetical protein